MRFLSRGSMAPNLPILNTQAVVAGYTGVPLSLCPSMFSTICMASPLKRTTSITPACRYCPCSSVTPTVQSFCFFANSEVPGSDQLMASSGWHRTLIPEELFAEVHTRLAPGSVGRVLTKIRGLSMFDRIRLSASVGTDSRAGMSMGRNNFRPPSLTSSGGSSVGPAL